MHAVRPFAGTLAPAKEATMAIPATLQLALNNNGINAGMPGWVIADAANLLPPIPGSALPIGDAPAAGLTKLMHAFYGYGRTHSPGRRTQPTRRWHRAC